MLCRQFEETVHHTYCNTTPSTPYPILVFVNHIIHVYVDFIPIVSTTSPDDALALLLAMYAIFELNFHKNSRSIRLLYAIVFADNRFLPNTIRDVIQEKQIDIYSELNRQQLTEINSITNKLVTESSITEQPHCSNDNNSSEYMIVNATKILNNNENATSASFDSSAPIVKGRKRPQKFPKTLTTEKPMPIDHDSDHENQNDCSFFYLKRLTCETIKFDEQIKIIWQCFICLFVQLASNNILFETIIIFNYRSSKLYNSSTSIVLNETWSIHYLDDFVQII
ncbi:unnamed protein product [Rotaria magnacalcarata]